MGYHLFLSYLKGADLHLELHALTWDQVDLEKGIIIVDRSYDSNMKMSGPTKGKILANGSN